jgi:hypothetical protein
MHRRFSALASVLALFGVEYSNALGQAHGVMDDHLLKPTIAPR